MWILLSIVGSAHFFQGKNVVFSHFFLGKSVNRRFVLVSGILYSQNIHCLRTIASSYCVSSIQQYRNHALTKFLMKSTLAAALCINTVFGNTMNIALNGQTFTATHDAADWRAPKVVTASGCATVVSSANATTGNSPHDSCTTIPGFAAKRGKHWARRQAR